MAVILTALMILPTHFIFAKDEGETAEPSEKEITAVDREIPVKVVWEDKTHEDDRPNQVDLTLLK